MTTCTTCTPTCGRCDSDHDGAGVRHRGRPRRRDVEVLIAHALQGLGQLRAGLVAVCAAACVATLVAQEPPNGWPTYHGDYSGRRHSGLTQITPANVHQLTLTWAFETGQTASIKASPI